MTDTEVKLRNQVEDGRQATIVLENVIFRRVAEQIRTELYEAFKGEDDEKALDARTKKKVFEELLNTFLRIQVRGKRATDSLKAMESERELERQGEKPKDFNEIQGIA